MQIIAVRGEAEAGIKQGEPRVTQLKLRLKEIYEDIRIFAGKSGIEMKRIS